MFSSSAYISAKEGACRNVRRNEEGTSKAQQLRRRIMSGRAAAAAANLHDSHRK